MNYLYRAIAAFPVLLLGILAKDRSLFVTFGLSVFVAACLFFPGGRYSGMWAGKKKWIVALGALALIVAFVIEVDVRKEASAEIAGILLSSAADPVESL